MTGAESLIRTLAGAGVSVCFANPGTSEIHLVSALDEVRQVRCVLGLFEGVVTGAADGYARMTRKPACTLLHLGPGLSNGLANLHNARRAEVPIVNLVGEHPKSHLLHDTPLASDIEAIAKPISKWLRTSQHSADLGRDVVEAILAALKAPGQITTLIVPADVAWSEGGNVASLPALPETPKTPAENIERAAAMLRSGKRTAILLAGDTLYGEGLANAGRIAASTNSKLFMPYPVTRVERGAGITAVERIQYVIEAALEQLKEFQQLILVGSKAPVAYFAYPGKNSVLTSPECEIHTLSAPNEDGTDALAKLGAALRVPSLLSANQSGSRPEMPSGPITLSGLAGVIGATLPENTIVVDESNTSGRGLMAATQGAPPHDWLCNTGGSIGIALPLAVGAAVACPDRRVLCLTADGSAMYTAQALWTMVREGLNVTTVVFANKSYAVLKREFSTLGVGEPGPVAAEMFNIGRPDIDWVLLAAGMGVPGMRVSSLDEFANALSRNLQNPGPSLIEVPL